MILATEGPGAGRGSRKVLPGLRRQGRAPAREASPLRRVRLSHADSGSLPPPSNGGRAERDPVNALACPSGPPGVRGRLRRPVALTSNRTRAGFGLSPSIRSVGPDFVAGSAADASLSARLPEPSTDRATHSVRKARRRRVEWWQVSYRGFSRRPLLGAVGLRLAFLLGKVGVNGSPAHMAFDASRAHMACRVALLCGCPNNGRLRPMHTAAAERRSRRPRTHGQTSKPNSS